MKNQTPASYKFLPWIRRGISTAIGQQNSDIQDEKLNANVKMTIKLHLNDKHEIDQTIRLLGPSDVVGIDTRQVIRTDPKLNAMDFEPNYFPLIEFDEPDFPWIFTPVQANSKQRLRPWICLIVVRKQEGVTLSSQSGKLAVLEIKSPAKPSLELPDLQDSWAWAHAQIVSISGDSKIEDILTRMPERTLSRLLCPRKLLPENQYLACLVPTFNVGRKVGLGEEINEQDYGDLSPSWTLSEDQIRMPVYYHWEFGTAPGGDFEELVKRLCAKPASSDVGMNSIDMCRAYKQIFGPETVESDQTIAMEGVLKSPTLNIPEWKEDSREAFTNRILKILNSGANDFLAPPLYGSIHSDSGLNVDEQLASSPIWLKELNGDPCHRIAAGLGAAVVRKYQDSLISAAWEQVGQIEEANQLVRQTQLAQANAQQMHKKRMQFIAPEKLLLISEPAHGRIAISANTSLFSSIRNSTLPSSALSSSLRKAVRRVGKNGIKISRLVSSFGKAHIKVKSARLIPSGAITLDSVTESMPKIPGETNTGLKFRDLVSEQITNAKPRLDFSISIRKQTNKDLSDNTEASTGKPSESSEASAFRAAAIRHLKRRLVPKKNTEVEQKHPLDFSSTRSQILDAIEPKHTFTSRLKSRIELNTADNIKNKENANCAQLQTSPRFNQAMYEVLAEIAPGFLLPGYEKISKNSICTLSINTRFIEAYMVGLNHEMSNELLWRGFPTDKRATYFQRFWSVESGDEEISEFAPIHKWSAANQLGENFSGAGANGEVVIAIRGDVIRRYPNAVVYMAKAVWSAGKRVLGIEECHPTFQGRLVSDIAFYGFRLNEYEIRGSRDQKKDPGWFLVVQEQPTELRFGIDTGGTFGSIPKVWKDLAWEHLAETKEALDNIAHVSVEGRLNRLTIENIQWGRTAADMASITVQNVMRVALHGETIVPEPITIKP